MQFSDDLVTVILPKTQKSKRKRSPNWETAEKTLLKSIIKDYIQAIENKSVDTNTTRRKQRAWQLLQKRFNKINMRERTLPEIKQQWRTIKFDAKKSFSAKQPCKLSGGQAKSPSPDKMQEIVNLILQENVANTNLLDSDAQITQAQIPVSDLDQDKDTVTMCDTQDNHNQRTKLETTKNTNHLKSDDFDKYSPNIIPQSKLFNMIKQGIKEAISEREVTLMNNEMKVENDLKIKQMIEAHQWAKKEHLIRLENLLLENRILTIKLEKQ